MMKQKQLILEVISAMGAINAAQLSRLLFETGLSDPFDVSWPLAELRQDGFLKQTVGENGILYILDKKGHDEIESASDEMLTLRDRIARVTEEYQALFMQERDYPAQYSEQANGIIPVFLSIRQGDKVLFKIHVIVHDVATAEKIKAHWMKNARGTYEACWQCIAPDEELPVFD